MITFRPISSVSAATEYFSSRGLLAEERDGRWMGRGCDAAGINEGGNVVAEDLRLVLSGQSLAGEPLYVRRHAGRTPGYDWCVSAHKSLSVAALCLTPRHFKTIREEFRDSVAAVFDAMRLTTAHSDREYGTIEAGDTFAASFMHHASRFSDPHLHAHILSPNTARTCDDDGWRNFNTVHTFRNLKVYDRLFQNELARRLVAKGYDVYRSGHFVALRVDAHICSTLSKAHRAIRDAMDLTGKPDAFAGVPEWEWSSILNDRIRPRKPDTPAFDRLLPPDVIERLSRDILVSPGDEAAAASRPGSSDVAGEWISPDESVRTRARVRLIHNDAADDSRRIQELADKLARRLRSRSLQPARQDMLDVMAESGDDWTNAAPLADVAAAALVAVEPRRKVKPVKRSRVDVASAMREAMRRAKLLLQARERTASRRLSPAAQRPRPAPAPSAAQSGPGAARKAVKPKGRGHDPGPRGLSP